MYWPDEVKFSIRTTLSSWSIGGDIVKVLVISVTSTHSSINGYPHCSYGRTQGGTFFPVCILSFQHVLETFQFNLAFNSLLVFIESDI